MVKFVTISFNSSLRNFDIFEIVLILIKSFFFKIADFSRILFANSRQICYEML